MGSINSKHRVNHLLTTATSNWSKRSKQSCTWRATQAGRKMAEQPYPMPTAC
jgi:hypothetical protein